MSMVCKEQEKTYNEEDTRQVLILADETPTTFPKTGENVDELPDYVKIDSGSVMLCLDTSSKYIFGNDGEWHKWTA